MFYSWSFGVKSVKITPLLSVSTRSVCHEHVWMGLLFQSQFCDAASLSCNPKKWMIYVTVTLRMLNNRECTSHTILLVFRQLVGFFNETAMLIEWLEKNTDEMFLAQAELDKRGEGELKRVLLPTSQRAHEQYLLNQSRDFISITWLNMWDLISIFFHYNRVSVY